MSDENLTEIQETETSTTEPEVVEEDAPELPRDWIKLADGTVLKCGAGQINTNTVWILIDDEANVSFIEAFTIFGDPLKTSHIERYFKDKLLDSWDGYTRLYDVKQNDRGRIFVGLRKPND